MQTTFPNALIYLDFFTAHNTEDYAGRYTQFNYFSYSITNFLCHETKLEKIPESKTTMHATGLKITNCPIKLFLVSSNIKTTDKLYQKNNDAKQVSTMTTGASDLTKAEYSRLYNSITYIRDIFSIPLPRDIFLSLYDLFFSIFIFELKYVSCFLWPLFLGKNIGSIGEIMYFYDIYISLCLYLGNPVGRC